MEVCTTLGMLTLEQAKELREAGLTAYNHNLDTSPEYYGKVRGGTLGLVHLSLNLLKPPGHIIFNPCHITSAIRFIFQYTSQ